MGKQQSDHIENRIRQAAEGVSPPFKEEGWLSMEELLNKEFKNRRPKSFLRRWLLLLLLLPGLAIYHYQLSSDGRKGRNGSLIEKAVVPVKKKTIKQAKDPLAKKSLSDQQPAIRRNETIGAVQKNKLHMQQGKKDFSLLPQDKVIAKNDGAGKIMTEPGPLKRINNSVNQKSEKRVVKREAIIIYATDSNGTKKQPATGNGVFATEITNKDPKPAFPDFRLLAHGSEVSVVGFQKPTIGSERTAPDYRLSTTGSRLYFTASIAPDASALKGSPLNNIGTVYGIGIGYRITKRLNVQTGLFAGMKIYKAGPSDYIIKPGSYWSMVEIIKIDADCFILEIPLSLRYDLIKRSGHNIYAVGGLSSTIMKNEDYNYHYKKNGDYNQSAHTYTGNKHLFSMVNFSAGFEKKILPALFIQAEPYIKIPLSGVGEGKVKLYGAGLQLGLKYQPMLRKKAKKF